nr:hypothetical protein Iba_chr13cCG15730 [Ipomoea batatas]
MLPTKLIIFDFHMIAVQQSKGKYPQRLYDSSYSRHTSTEQGHALITPNAKTSIFLAKDRCSQPVEIDRLPLSDLTNDLHTQDSEFVRVHLSDVTNVRTSMRDYRQVLNPTNNENSWNRGTGQILNNCSFVRASPIHSMENTQDHNSEINRNLLRDFVDASQLQDQVPPQLQGNTIHFNTMFWFA